MFPVKEYEKEALTSWLTVEFEKHWFLLVWDRFPCCRSKDLRARAPKAGGAFCFLQAPAAHLSEKSAVSKDAEAKSSCFRKCRKSYQNTCAAMANTGSDSLEMQLREN
uniref:DDE-1 domain-containing protein n=1 Tax=Trichuris muris TaxID=70415 RepID=A0A5S6QAQ5_TRIMR